MKNNYLIFTKILSFFVFVNYGSIGLCHGGQCLVDNDCKYPNNSSYPKPCVSYHPYKPGFKECVAIKASDNPHGYTCKCKDPEPEKPCKNNEDCDLYFLNLEFCYVHGTCSSSGDDCGGDGDCKAGEHCIVEGKCVYGNLPEKSTKKK